MISSYRHVVQQSTRAHFQKLSAQAIQQATPTTFLRFSSSTERHDDLEIRSARAQFKQLPVNQSILKYVKSVGVGIPSKKKRRRRNGRHDDDRVLLTAEEERVLFQHRSSFAHNNPPKRQIPPLPFTTNLRSRTYTVDGKTVEVLPVKLLAAAGSDNEDEFPKASAGLPEVAIAGRSNVGKSTLLNALLYGSQPQVEDEESSHQQRTPPRRRKPKRQTAKLPRGLKAVASARPGETRTISFFQLSAKIDKARASLLLVDLPGYGFAFAADEAMEKWQATMQSYLIGRGNGLKRVLLLIDSRHGMKSADMEFLNSLQQALQDHKMKSNDDKRPRIPPIQIVLTKCDLVNQSDLARRVEMVRKQLSDSLRRQTSALPIMLVSAQIEGQAGLIELQRELAALVPVQNNVQPSTAPTHRNIDDSQHHGTPEMSFVLPEPRNTRRPPPHARRAHKSR